MNTDLLVDEFVRKINAGLRERLQEVDAPAAIRRGKPDRYGGYDWQIVEADGLAWLKDAMESLPQHLPRSYLSLITRYAFPGFQCGEVFLFANTGSGTTFEFKDMLSRDKHMSPFLLQNGFIHVGSPVEYNYDPICFDTNQKRQNREYPLVHINHEGVLCHSRIMVRKCVASSFCAFVRDFVEHE